MPIGVIPKLGLIQPLSPLMRASMHEATQDRLKALIDPFGLTIRLRMISHTHPQLNSSQLKQLTPEMTRKDFVSIRDNGLQHTMQLIHLRDKTLSP